MKQALVFALLIIGSTGCQAYEESCERVAEIDDAMAETMQALRLMGLLERCQMDCAVVALPEDQDVCEEVKRQACNVRDSVLTTQSGVLAAYRLCFDD